VQALGLGAVLSLRAERGDVFDGPPPERALRLEVPDFHPPSVEQLREAVAFIQAAHSERLPVLVHCHAGVGRASLTASAYLVTRGLSRIEAFDRIGRARPIVALNNVQLERLVEGEWLLRDQASPGFAAPVALSPAVAAGQD